MPGRTATPQCAAGRVNGRGRVDGRGPVFGENDAGLAAPNLVLTEAWWRGLRVGRPWRVQPAERGLLVAVYYYLTMRLLAP